jgi:uncharacterized membrane protein
VAIGAGAGALTGKILDRGFDDSFLQGLAGRLQPGRSGILVIVQTEWVASVQQAFAGTDGVMFQQQLTDRLVAAYIGEDTPKP